MKDLYICRTCWVIATPKNVIKGSFLIEIVLWCLFIIPGVLYSIWRFITKDKVCPVCSSLAVVPINSLMGRKLLCEPPRGKSKDINGAAIGVTQVHTQSHEPLRIKGTYHSLLLPLRHSTGYPAKAVHKISSKRNTRFINRVLNYQQDDFIKVDYKSQEGSYQDRET
jgi:hypothetical protein